MLRTSCFFVATDDAALPVITRKLLQTQKRYGIMHYDWVNDRYYFIPRRKAEIPVGIWEFSSICNGIFSTFPLFTISHWAKTNRNISVQFITIFADQMAQKLKDSRHLQILVDFCLHFYRLSSAGACRDTAMIPFIYLLYFSAIYV